MSWSYNPVDGAITVKIPEDQKHGKVVFREAHTL